MSAYGHEMEREFSAQSLPSRGASEIGSRYTTEAGMYMSSFAAAVFISGLVTVGVLLLSLLVSMTVMLRSCESKNSGIIEKYSYTKNYDYCWSFRLHAELNSLGASSFPAICKDVNAIYIKEGQYRKDLNISVRIAEDFFGNVKPGNDGRDVVLMDADDLLPSEDLSTNQLMHMNEEDAAHNNDIDAEYSKHIFVKDLYINLQSGGWKLILLSRKHEKLRNATEKNLISVGCHGWSSLIMRNESEMQTEFEEFSSRQRTILQIEGFRIIASISSGMDSLRGACLGRIFKLPNPIIVRNMLEGSTVQGKRKLQSFTRVGINETPNCCCSRFLNSIHNLLLSIYIACLCWCALILSV